MDLDAVATLDAWLDDNVGVLYKEQPLAQDWARISKVQEELGEAVRAFIGYTHQNPRKIGEVPWSDVINELADTAVTAILAMQHFTKDAKQVAGILDESFDHIMRRAGLRA
jgi:hypothetical protein